MITANRSARFALGVSVLSLTAGTAWAAGTLTTNNITFATQAVSASGGAITLPSTGATYADSIVYTTGTLSGSATSTGSFTLVFTLPSGVTTASATALVATTGGGAACTTGTITGTVSSNVLTFTVATTNTGTAGNQCTVTLGNLSLTGATALATATTSSTTTASGFLITAQVTSVSNSTVPADSSAIKYALASSASALSVTLGAGATGYVDTSGDKLNGVTTLGKAFFPGTTTNVESLVFVASTTSPASAGSFTTALSTTALNAVATGPYLSTGTTGSITVTGNLSGVGSIFLDTATTFGSCASTTTTEATSSTAVAGSISGSVATFANLPAGLDNLCVYAAGTSLLGTNPNGVQVTAAFGGASASPSGAPGIYTVGYSSATPYFVTYAGNISSYPSFTRVVNNSVGSVNVFAEVQADSNGGGSLTEGTGLVATVSGLTNTLVADSTIISNAGVTLDSSGRASLILWAVPMNVTISTPGASIVGSGAGQVGISHLLVNPNGTVVQLGGGSSP